jgi:hypothetical protein
MLHPFEEMYRRNMQDQQKKAQISRQAGAQNQHPASIQGRPTQVAASSPQSAQLQRGPQGPLPMNGVSQFPNVYSPHTPHPRPSSANPGLAQSEQSTPHNLSAIPDVLLDLPQTNGFGDGNVLDQEMQGLKRKLDFDTEDTKRARQKTGQCHYPLYTPSAQFHVPESEAPEAAVCLRPIYVFWKLFTDVRSSQVFRVLLSRIPHLCHLIPLLQPRQSQQRQQFLDLGNSHPAVKLNMFP